MDIFRAPRGEAGMVAAASDDEAAALAVARSDDAEAFTALAERYRRQLHVHCYRMVGSLEDAEDLVQETLLRAWRGRPDFEGRSLFRTWLYRIATNLCLNALERQPRRVLPNLVAPPSPDPRAPLPAPPGLPWLQPYPDGLLDGIADDLNEPGELVTARETIELAFLATIQLLPSRQRAVLILRDVLGWTASETAALLAMSVAAANSALQRARATLRERLPARREQWAHAECSEEETALLRRLMDTYDRGDTGTWAELLSADARLIMPPYPVWFQGRDNVLAFLEHRFGDRASPAYTGPVRAFPTLANRQPALAFYSQHPGDTEYRPLSLSVFRIEGHAISEIVSFVSDPKLFSVFGLPSALGRTASA